MSDKERKKAIKDFEKKLKDHKKKNTVLILRILGIFDLHKV